AEAFEFLRLLRREDEATFAAFLLQLQDLALGLLELRLQRLLLLAELALRLEADLVHHLERPREPAAAAQAHEVAAAGEVLDGVDHEVAVVGDGLRHLNAEEALGADP